MDSEEESHPERNQDRQRPSRWTLWRREKKMKVEHIDTCHSKHNISEGESCARTVSPHFLDHSSPNAATQVKETLEPDSIPNISTYSGLGINSSDVDSMSIPIRSSSDDYEFPIMPGKQLVGEAFKDSPWEELVPMAGTHTSGRTSEDKLDEECSDVCTAEVVQHPGSLVLSTPSDQHDCNTPTARMRDVEDFLSSDEDVTNCDDFQVRFLDLNPGAGVGDAVGDDHIAEAQDLEARVLGSPNPEDPYPNDSDPDDSDPDDPDPGDPDPEDRDPEDVVDSDDSEASEGSDDNFDFDDEALNAPLRCAGGQGGRSIREALLLTLATSLRHNHSYEALLDAFRSMNTIFAGQPFPKSKQKLWSIVNRRGSGLTAYAYCNRCLAFLGKRAELEAHVVCDQCGFASPMDKLKWFVSMSLRKQLEHFLSFPGIAELLQYSETRQKINPEGIEDIFDGERYQQLMREGKIVAGERTFTYVFNTDGFRVAKQGNVSAWGLLVRLNELPPALRQKHMFLGGLWVDTREPRMNTFLRPFVSQVNRLSANGVAWKPDGINEVRSKIIPLCFCVDAKARFAMLNMTQYNGEFGCTFCTHTGVQIHGSRYPVLPHEDLPPAQVRTHDSIIEAMHAGVPFEGQKGPSELMLMDDLNLGAGGNAMDDLHPLYEGVACFHTELLVGDLNEETIRLIDGRLLQMKTPTCVSRKPCSITKRRQWKGSDWRNWLLYLAVPCLQDLITEYHLQHLQMLSYSAFLLCRESIDQVHLDESENLLQRYIRLFQEYHGVPNMRYNVHLLSHIVDSVRQFGPLWTTSTFNFESWNHNIRKTITSPKGVIDQIVSRHLMRFHVHVALQSDLLSDRVKSEITYILSKTHKRIRAQDLGNNTHVLGAASVRRPTQEEVDMIADQGFNCVGNLSEYQRLIFRGVEYRCPEYHPHTRSDNCSIYTHDDWFGTISSIVTFRNEAGDTVCGFFVEQHNVINPFVYASHFGEIVDDSLETFLHVSRVRSLAIKLRIRESVFIVPMSNNFEID